MWASFISNFWAFVKGRLTPIVSHVIKNAIRFGDNPDNILSWEEDVYIKTETGE